MNNEIIIEFSFRGISRIIEASVSVICLSLRLRGSSCVAGCSHVGCGYSGGSYVGCGCSGGSYVGCGCSGGSYIGRDYSGGS